MCVILTCDLSRTHLMRWSCGVVRWATFLKDFAKWQGAVCDLARWFEFQNLKTYKILDYEVLFITLKSLVLKKLYFGMHFPNTVYTCTFSNLRINFFLLIYIYFMMDVFFKYNNHAVIFYSVYGQKILNDVKIV